MVKCRGRQWFSVFIYEIFLIIFQIVLGTYLVDPSRNSYQILQVILLRISTHFRNFSELQSDSKKLISDIPENLVDELVTRLCTDCRPRVY